jgi:GT2 family glycosyltransferase
MRVKDEVQYRSGARMGNGVPLAPPVRPAAQSGVAILGDPLNVSFESVSVIVVNHNAGTLLRDCVCSALEQAAQIIVVDNDSTDGSMELLAARFAGEQRLTTQFVGKNLGFAAGCNLGMDHAIHSHLLFLNPDCVLGQGALRRMVAALDSDPAVGMVGGLLVNLDGSEQGGGRRAVPTPWRSFVRAFGLNRLSNRWPKLFFDFYLHTQPLPTSPIEVEAISGALMLVSRAAVQDVGRWDEAYFLHCEDLDWCMRFRQRKWKILFVPDAPVVHHLGHSSRVRPYFVEWHKHKGMVHFYRKFFQNQYPGALMWLVDAGVWFRFGLVSIHHWSTRLWKRMRGENE